MSEYTEKLFIDRDRLDREFLQQPAIYMEYAQQAAEADDERDAAKRRVEVVRAEVDQEIRERAAVAGEKITEAVVAARVLLDPRTEKAEAQLRKATLDAKVLGAAVRAFEQRKKSLEKLADLWCQGYYSTPEENRGGKETRKQTEKLQERMNKER